MLDRNGKRLNAVKHGAFAKTAVLPGEDPAEFEQLYSSLIEEWIPLGPTEKDAVLSIAKGVWRKRRAQKLLQAQIEKCRVDPKHPLYDESHRVRRFLSVMKTAPFLSSLETAPEVFERIYDELVSSMLPALHAEHLREACPRQKFKSGSEWLQALRNEITRTILRSYDILGETPDPLLGRAAEFLTPEIFKHELAVDERIDAMIDRAVKRLVQTKAMKQMLGDASRNGEHEPNQKNPKRQARRIQRALSPEV